jgi:hypothetical protein
MAATVHMPSPPSPPRHASAWCELVWVLVQVDFLLAVALCERGSCWL